MPRHRQPSDAVGQTQRTPKKARKRTAPRPEATVPTGVESERQRIAQLLHDTVCQELTGICLLASAAAFQAQNRDAASGRQFEEISDQIQRTGANLAALVHGLRAGK